MITPKIYCALGDKYVQLEAFLDSIGAKVTDLEKANAVLIDSPDKIERGVVNFCVLQESEPAKGYVTIPDISSYQNMYQFILQIMGAIENKCLKCNVDESETDSDLKRNAEIVAGFARHFSHNVLNSLLMAGGFLKQIRSAGQQTDHLNMLWKIVADKLQFIEELVNGYNDYNYVLALQMNENIDIVSFYHDLIVAVASKKFEKAFSAYLSYHTSEYNMTYDFYNNNERKIECNSLFLKLAFCYIIKDTIRYLATENNQINFHIATKYVEGSFQLDILVRNTFMSQEIIDTMFEPWNHKMFVQSFDYWGLVIAQTIINRHNGVFTVVNSEDNLLYTLVL